MTGTAPPKAPSHLKADVWLHFRFKTHKDTQELDKNKAVCKLCKIEVKYCGNTTNLPDTQSAKTPLQQSSVDKAFVCKLQPDSLSERKITAAAATFICKDIRPYRVVENSGF